jgi:hypothetical protein
VFGFWHGAGDFGDHLVSVEQLNLGELDWLISTTAMIVLFWSRATRDLLKSFGWGIAALHRLM